MGVSSVPARSLGWLSPQLRSTPVSLQVLVALLILILLLGVRSIKAQPQPTPTFVVK